MRVKIVLTEAAPDQGIPLADLAPGQTARLCEPVNGQTVSRRLEDLGFVPGTAVTVVRRAPFGGPIELELRGYRLCLRVRQLHGLRVRLDGNGAD